jgi:hypothetical protein
MDWSGLTQVGINTAILSIKLGSILSSDRRLCRGPESHKKQGVAVVLQVYRCAKLHQGRSSSAASQTSLGRSAHAAHVLYGRAGTEGFNGRHRTGYRSRDNLCSYRATAS